MKIIKNISSLTFKSYMYIYMNILCNFFLVIIKIQKNFDSFQKNFIWVKACENVIIKL